MREYYAFVGQSSTTNASLTNQPYVAVLVEEINGVVERFEEYDINGLRNAIEHSYNEKEKAVLVRLLEDLLAFADTKR